MPESSKRPDTVRLQRISKAFWESAALMSAIELGAFTAIASGHDTIVRWTSSRSTPSAC